MVELADLATGILIVIALVALGFFSFGTIANIRAGNRAMKWLREGLSVIGEKTTMSWIGSAAVQFKIAKAKGAFRSTETVFAFEPRDVVFLWLFARWQGRRDLMILRGTQRGNLRQWMCLTGQVVSRSHLPQVYAVAYQFPG
jgi:hypothetical protein